MAKFSESPWVQGFGANSNALIGLGTGLLSGQNFAQGLAAGGQGWAQGAALDMAAMEDAQAKAEQQQAENQTIEWLRSKGYNDLVQGVESGALDIGTAFTEGMRMSQPQAPDYTAEQRNFLFAQGNPEFAQFIGAGQPDMTDTQQNLMWRAQQAGLQPNTPEYQQFMMSGGQGGTSLSVDPATGGVSFTQGFAGKPLTEQQSKDTVYSVRAEGALAKLDPIDTELTNPWARAVEGDPTGLARGTQSPQFQQAAQAGKEFLQAILRKDTGAAITPQETAEYGTVYLPVPGDSPQVIEQKRISRARALEAMKAGMPPQAILAQERALLSGAGGDAPTAVNPQTGQKVRWDGSNWVPFT